MTGGRWLHVWQHWHVPCWLVLLPWLMHCIIASHVGEPGCHQWHVQSVCKLTDSYRQNSKLLQLFALCKARLHFDSEIKSPSRERHISLNSGWNHLVFCGPYSEKNKLVHWHQKYAKRNLQKSGIFEVLLLLANAIPDKRLIGNV